MITPYKNPFSLDNVSGPNNIVYEAHAYIPKLDEYLSSDRLIKANILFYLDKDSFCNLMKMHDYTLDTTKMEPKAKALKFTHEKYTIFFQQMTEDNKRVYCVLMISYKTGPVRSIIFNGDGSMHEITYRSDEDFHIKQKMKLSIHNGETYYQMSIHNSLRSKCYLDWIVMVSGQIREAHYSMNGKIYPLNKLRQALGQPAIELERVKDHVELTNLFTPEDVLLIEMALC